MVIYDDAGLYLAAQTTIQSKIAAIDAIIDALLISAATSAGKAHITSYSLNSGQTQINTSLRGTAAVAEAIKEFEYIKNKYIAKLNGNGRVSRAIDGGNLIGPINCR